MNQEYVSIIIPTYREWHFLEKCIAALDQQSYSKDFFEIIVVNNDLKVSIPDNFYLPENCKIIVEEKPGSYAARNAAIKISKGKIIGFTDSDCIPEKDWIKTAVDYLNTNVSCSRIAGNIKIIQNSGNSTIINKYNEIYSFPQRWLIEHGGGSITANLFTYKFVFDKIGDFDETLMSMGDKYWGMLAQDNGFNVHYVDDVIVYHPSRSLKQLVKKEKRHGGAVTKAVGKTKFSLFLNFVYEFRPRYSGVRFMFGRRKDISIIERITIPILRHYLLVVRAYESLKIHLGKSPNRT